MAATSASMNAWSRTSARAASMAGCAQRHTGYALKYCSRMRQRLTQVLKNSRAIIAFDRQRGCAGETVACEQRGAYACVRAPPGAVLDHRRRIADAQDLAARSEIFRNSQRMTHAFIVEFEPATAQCCASKRVPCAGAMVIGHCRMQRDAGARRDFIADTMQVRNSRPSLRDCEPTPPSRYAISAGSIATPAWPLVSTWPSCASNASMVVAPANAAPAKSGAAAVKQDPRVSVTARQSRDA